MLDYIRINKIKEADLDEVVASAGGERISCHGPCKPLNADYTLGEAVIELKLLEEEGLNKSERREKIASLFSRTQSSRPVVVIDPGLLNKEESRKYYNLLARPIQTAVRKSADQLAETERRLYPGSTRVLIIVNNGYSALSPEEFNTIVAKCVRHDTSKIDHAVAAGIYYYSDKFDSYVISYFEHILINLAKPFPSCDRLLESWNNWLGKFMTSMVIRESVDESGKFPVVDLRYEVDGIIYLKPAPKMGEPSKFWPDGKRPRTNSTGITTCPAVATCFPRLTEVEWEEFKATFPHIKKLERTFAAWIKSLNTSQAESDEPLLPFVSVPVACSEFEYWTKTKKREQSFASLCDYSVEIFQKMIHEVLDTSKDVGLSKILPTSYISLIVDEIGQDKANDISSIYIVSSLPGFERETALVENQKLFFEHSLALAAAYAIRNDIPFVYYKRDHTYRWI